MSLVKFNVRLESQQLKAMKQLAAERYNNNVSEAIRSQIKTVPNFEAIQ